MTDQRTETIETETNEAVAAPRETVASRRAASAARSGRGPDGILLDPDAARAEARRGWIMLTLMFVGGAVLVAIAAVAT